MQVGKTSLVVGLAALSFNSATREQMPTLQPPDKAAYLSTLLLSLSTAGMTENCPPQASLLSHCGNLLNLYCTHKICMSCHDLARDQSNLFLLTWSPCCRKGIASALLKVCEQVTQDALLNRLYLHARVADAGAQAFYKNAGYLEEGRDGSLTAMWHRISPRVLLCKALPVIE